MKDRKTRLVIRGNELYEIDLDCVKRRQEGKPCREEKDREEAEKKKEKPETKSPAPGGAGGHRQGKSAFDGKKSYDRVGSTPVSAETQHG